MPLKMRTKPCISECWFQFFFSRSVQCVQVKSWVGDEVEVEI